MIRRRCQSAAPSAWAGLGATCHVIPFVEHDVKMRPSHRLLDQPSLTDVPATLDNAGARAGELHEEKFLPSEGLPARQH